MRNTIAVLEQRVAATRAGRDGIAEMPIVGVIETTFDHYVLSRRRPAGAHARRRLERGTGHRRTVGAPDSRRLYKAAIALFKTYNAFLTDHKAGYWA